MKKHSTAKTTARRNRLARVRELTIGMDLGDRVSRYCILDETGDVISEGSVPTTKAGMNQIFGPMACCRIAMETGAHSPWVSRQLSGFGHEVIVANARNVRLIGESTRKDDRLDAKTLARLARIDPGLLSPVRHHSAQGQAHLTVMRARAVLVSARTTLVNAARGLVKPHGESLRRCGTQQFGKAIGSHLPAELGAALEPLLSAVEALNEQIQLYEQQLEHIAKEEYPQIARLKQVDGVGTLIALSFMLTIEDPHRFRRSRDVGCYFGLRPGRRSSGASQPQLHISKEGDRYLRKLMVQGAHHILGPFGKDCDLRRWGLKLAERGGKNAKKRAIVAVARKLAVLLHRLWVSGAIYDPLRNSQTQMGRAAA